MPKRPRGNDPEALRLGLIDLFTNFEHYLRDRSRRDQVRALTPAHKQLQDLGCSLLPQGSQLSARERILLYFRTFPAQVIDGDELMIVAGISEYARRLRELRVEEGWPILSGMTAREQRDADEEGGDAADLPPAMRPDQYMLQADRQDRDGAHRWNMANQIRKSDAGVRDKLLRFFRANVGKPITSEELRYVAGNVSEWARRTRELRTEDGWPVVTRTSGDPSLPVGVYVLMRDEQAPPHDRHIPEIVRREVMRRDDWSCRWVGCGWPNGFPESDHRYLEAHHIVHHHRGGENTAQNLVTLCNLHHDETHRSGALNTEPL